MRRNKDPIINYITSLMQKYEIIRAIMQAKTKEHNIKS